MRASDELWLLLAFGAVYAMTRDVVPWGDSTLWHWPVPDLLTDGADPLPSTLYYPATVSQEWRANHLGVDVMYRRLAVGGRSVPDLAAGDHGNAEFFAPASTPILAARDGVVWSVDTSPRGIEVVLDHGKPFATYYQHLASTQFPAMARGRTRNGAVIRVKAGDVIGTMGYDPTDPQGLRHLHFAVWNGGDNSTSVDPQNAMRSWQRSAWRH